MKLESVRFYNCPRLGMPIAPRKRYTNSGQRNSLTCGNDSKPVNATNINLMTYHAYLCHVRTSYLTSVVGALNHTYPTHCTQISKAIHTSRMLKLDVVIEHIQMMARVRPIREPASKSQSPPFPVWCGVLVRAITLLLLALN